jgi:hypothetical protein
MPDWLKQAAQDDLEASLGLLAIRLGAAFVLGCLAAGVYRATRGRTEGEKSFLATLVLLSVLIAMVTLVIGTNTARAFSLVGALAIVRFRTVVEDTRDTAFVMFAVVVGMAAGAGFFLTALAGVPFVALAALIFRSGKREKDEEHALSVRVGVAAAPEALLKEAFAAHLSEVRLVAATTARQGAALELTYAVRLRQADGAVALVSALNRVEGVQNVELRR